MELVPLGQAYPYNVREKDELSPSIHGNEHQAPSPEPWTAAHPPPDGAQEANSCSGQEGLRLDSIVIDSHNTSNGGARELDSSAQLGSPRRRAENE
jgi:hypothetical protein